MKHKFNVKTKTLLADLQTPVGIYLKLRDLHPESALLESSDYHSSENSYSFIGVSPLARFKLDGDSVSVSYPDGSKKTVKTSKVGELNKCFVEFLNEFEFEGENPSRINGLFGYTSYDAIRCFENIKLAGKGNAMPSIPDFYYIFYRFVLVINHLKNELVIVENIPELGVSEMQKIEAILANKNFASYNFKAIGGEISLTDDNVHKNNVEKCIEYCKDGTLSQIVLSRAFSQQYSGDDFKVYRSLRSINPSPYLFYFDFGSFRIFGSSPETNCRIAKNRVYIDPIAGTYFRTGDDEKDKALADSLLKDPKENIEHDMLVELAQNELSVNCGDIKVDFYKNVQFYSHVIHLVSRVSGRINEGIDSFRVYADTFPAGTLTGAPKLKAMQIIDEMEVQKRGAYGGCIGYMGFNGDLNQAITIRSFISVNNTLYYQAGSGIVAESNADTEIREVKNKLGALKKAVDFANEFNAS